MLVKIESPFHIFNLPDDALLMGEWSSDNTRNLSRILSCFHLASGLNINFSKSKLFGVGVTPFEVSNFASILGCQASSFPTTYLGLPIGSNLTNYSKWMPIIEKFQKKIVSLEIKTLIIWWSPHSY